MLQLLRLVLLCLLLTARTLNPPLQIPIELINLLLPLLNPLLTPHLTSHPPRSRHPPQKARKDLPMNERRIALPHFTFFEPEEMFATE